MPVGLWLARWLAVTAWPGRPLVAALLLLLPTVIGFYFLMAFGQGSPLGAWLADTLGLRLVFSLHGLLTVSLLVNLPFMVQPIQRAFAAVPHSLREAAWVSGMCCWWAATFPAKHAPSRLRCSTRCRACSCRPPMRWRWPW